MVIFKRTTPLSAKSAFVALSILMFFFSAQVSLTIYVDSSYIEHAIAQTPSLSSLGMWQSPEHVVGTLYTFAALITLLALIFAPRILRKLGNYRWTLLLLVLHILLLLGLSLFETAWLIVPLFIIESALVSTLYFNFDVFLERYSDDKKTGVVRGLFMVIGSIAWLFPPFIAGQIIEQYGFHPVYLLGSAIMIPTLFIMIRSFSDFKDLPYDDVPIIMSPEESRRHPDIHRILMSNFFLQFFYAWMIIYVPLYFHDYLAISYGDFGIILTIALSAFIIFPYPAGWIADKLIGEKELLVTGFLLMAITSALIPTLADAKIGLTLWAILLFVGRTGASTVETMSESYFFKQIDGRNAGLIGYFRRSRPLAFIAAPILASLLLEFDLVTLGELFYILALIMLFAIYYPLRMRDTK